MDIFTVIIVLVWQVCTCVKTHQILICIYGSVLYVNVVFEKAVNTHVCACVQTHCSPLRMAKIKTKNRRCQVLTKLWSS